MDEEKEQKPKLMFDVDAWDQDTKSPLEKLKERDSKDRTLYGIKQADALLEVNAHEGEDSEEDKQIKEEYDHVTKNEAKEIVVPNNADKLVAWIGKKFGKQNGKLSKLEHNLNKLINRLDNIDSAHKIAYNEIKEDIVDRLRMAGVLQVSDHIEALSAGIQDLRERLESLEQDNKKTKTIIRELFNKCASIK